MLALSESRTSLWQSCANAVGGWLKRFQEPKEIPFEDLNHWSQVHRIFSGEVEGYAPSGGTNRKREAYMMAFMQARNTVRILENGFTPNLFDDENIIREAQAFLMRGNRIEVLVEYSTELAQKFIDRLRSVGGDNVDIHIVPSKIANEYRHNFLLVDDRACRFQGDRQYLGSIAGGEKYKATVEDLARKFEAIKAESLPYRPGFTPQDETAPAPAA